MTRLIGRILRKYLLPNQRINYPRKLNRKYILTGVSLTSAAVAISNANSSENIVVGARGIVRFCRSIQVGVAMSLDYYFSMLGLSPDAPNYQVMMNRIHQRCAEMLRDACLYNGGTYIKLGQGLVAMSHALPKPYITTLKILHDKCLARDKDELYEVFQEEFGKSPEELFETFDSDPIAAASIAQVFRGKTKEGEEVAIKVQYNDLQRRFKGDTFTIDILLNIVAFLHPKFDLSWVWEDMTHSLKEELDFMREGANAERCAKDLSQFKYVHVPKVFWKYTSSRILVAEFIDGININDLEELKKQKFSLEDINYKLFEAFGHQIFQSGFIHADPHPGNLFIRRKNGQTQLVILDHGLYQELSSDQRLNLSKFWKALVLGNHDQMKAFSRALGVDDYVLFAEILTQCPLKTMGFKLKAALSKEEENHAAKMATERFDKIVVCLKQMPRPLLLVIRNLNTIRGICYDHGSPINRFVVLARMATKSTFENNFTGLLDKLMSALKKLWFEVNLLVTRMLIYWRTLIFRLLFLMGVTPNVNAIIENTARQL